MREKRMKKEFIRCWRAETNYQEGIVFKWDFFICWRIRNIWYGRVRWPSFTRRGEEFRKLGLPNLCAMMRLISQSSLSLPAGQQAPAADDAFKTAPEQNNHREPDKTTKHRRFCCRKDLSEKKEIISRERIEIKGGQGTSQISWIKEERQISKR